MSHSNIWIPEDCSKLLNFVQARVIIGTEASYLWFGNPQDAHRKVLVDALARLGIGYRWERNSFGFPIPLKRGERYEVTGLGMALVMKGGRIIKAKDGVFGDYMIGIERNGLEESVMSLGPRWRLEFVDDFE